MPIIDMRTGKVLVADKELLKAAKKWRASFTKDEFSKMLEEEIKKREKVTSEGKFLPFRTVQRKYKTIMYKASDGKWYLLSNLYPICMAVARDKDAVYLDTGGHMSECHFNVYKFTKSAVYLHGVGKVADVKYGKEE